MNTALWADLAERCSYLQACAYTPGMRVTEHQSNRLYRSPFYRQRGLRRMKVRSHVKPLPSVAFPTEPVSPIVASVNR